MSGSWKQLNVYFRSYDRALLKYVNNGFFSRDLDADDHAFIEKVREQGTCDCGSLVSAVPNGINYGYTTNALVLEGEQEYWRKPFAGEAFRRVMVPRLPEPDHVRLARIERRKRDRAMMEAELEAARKEWQAQQEQRKRNQLRRLMDDLAWENADPKRRAKKRHYEPEWKREERLAPRRMRDAKRELRAHRARLAEHKRMDEAELAAAHDWEKQATERAAASLADAADLAAARERSIAEQRSAIKNMIAAAQEIDQAKLPQFNPPFCDLKQSLENILRDDATIRKHVIAGLKVSSLPHWLVLTLMSRAKCSDLKLTIRCVRQVVEEQALVEQAK